MEVEKEEKDPKNMEVEQDEPPEVKETKDMEVEQDEPTEVKDTEPMEKPEDEPTEVKDTENKEKKLEEDLEKENDNHVNNEKPEIDSDPPPPKKRVRTKADVMAAKAANDAKKALADPTGASKAPKRAAAKAKSTPKKRAKKAPKEEKKLENDDTTENERKADDEEKEKPNENETKTPNDDGTEPADDTKATKKKRTRRPPGDHTFAKRYAPSNEYGLAKFNAIRDAFNETIKPSIASSWKHQEPGLGWCFKTVSAYVSISIVPYFPRRFYQNIMILKLAFKHGGWKCQHAVCFPKLPHLLPSTCVIGLRFA